MIIFVYPCFIAQRFMKLKLQYMAQEVPQVLCVMCHVEESSGVEELRALSFPLIDFGRDNALVFLTELPPEFVVVIWLCLPLKH